MTFDESNALITQELSGKTIDYVTRLNKELEIHLTSGATIRLKSDINHDIHFMGKDVKIFIPKINKSCLSTNVINANAKKN